MKRKKPARIIPLKDKNGATYWCVHPDDRIVRELPPSPEKVGDGKGTGGDNGE